MIDGFSLSASGPQEGLTERLSGTGWTEIEVDVLDVAEELGSSALGPPRGLAERLSGTSRVGVLEDDVEVDMGAGGDVGSGAVPGVLGV